MADLCLPPDNMVSDRMVFLAQNRAIHLLFALSKEISASNILEELAAPLPLQQISLDSQESLALPGFESN